MVVRVRNFFTGFLCCGVQARWLVRTIFLGEGNSGIEAVDGTGRGPDHRRLRVRRLAGLEDVDEAGQVAVDVRGRVLHGVSDAGLSRQVHDVAELDQRKEPLEQPGVVDVGLDDEDPGFLQPVLAGPLQRRVVVLVEVVEADDAVAALLQRQRDVRADEAGRAGDEDGEAVVVARLRREQDEAVPLGPASEEAAGIPRREVVTGGFKVEVEKDEEQEGREPDDFANAVVAAAPMMTVMGLVHLQKIFPRKSWWGGKFVGGKIIIFFFFLVLLLHIGSRNIWNSVFFFLVHFSFLGSSVFFLDWCD